MFDDDPGGDGPTAGSVLVPQSILIGRSCRRGDSRRPAQARRHAPYTVPRRSRLIRFAQTMLPRNIFFCPWHPDQESRLRALAHWSHLICLGFAARVRGPIRFALHF